MRLAELAQICGAKLEGNGDHEIKDVARIETATREQICFVADKTYLPALEKSRAGAVVTQPGVPVPQGMNALRADDPDLAFSKAVGALRPEPPRPLPGIADHTVIGKRFEMGEGSSVGAFTFIGDGVKLGKNVVIYPHCYVGDEVTIGDNTVLFPHVTLLERCRVGKNCTLHSGARVGNDGFGYHFVAGKFVKAPQRGIVVIEDDVEIGANTTIDRARFDITLVRRGTKIDNLVQIAHNVQIGQNCVLAGLSGVAGSAVLKDYVMLGGNAGIADHITIGMGAKVAAKTGVMQDVAPGQKVAGLPADEGKAYMRREAAVRRLPDLMADFRELKALVAKLAGQVGLPPERAEEDDFKDAQPGAVTRFLRSRPAPIEGGEQPPAQG
ncbi:MAG: UDP-3-O-(3-hydroxymyristoyl)glucosamine N-acyltransferase [Planctomycetes bacterium]|nr:UDP-3-O-(3-hydroxymyristoyl)glucosamine N-acyltransferase [Planctomycetota bacterium]MCL4729372.1 UDP-3-O-(3-hydroxymyristoyl)glucosamine N-acyltransferase [Planctomycetota bacterium]